jgi:hypothetical protein
VPGVVLVTGDPKSSPIMLTVRKGEDIAGEAKVYLFHLRQHKMVEN